ncbi:MAG: hypothetical protein U0836_08710 [Pirellulales bacterium]
MSPRLQFGIRSFLFTAAVAPPLVVVVGPAVVRLFGYHLVAALGAAICIWSLYLTRQTRREDEEG